MRKPFSPPDPPRLVRLADGRVLDEAEVGSAAMDRLLQKVEVMDATAIGDARRVFIERVDARSAARYRG